MIARTYVLLMLLVAAPACPDDPAPGPDTAADTSTDEASSDAAADVSNDAPADVSEDTTPGPPALSMDEIERRARTLADDTFGGRDEGTAGWEAAKAFLIDELSACGIAPLEGDSYEHAIPSGDGVNLLGVIPGADAALADRHVILSAHYDHLGTCGGAICNGADDNAAAVAMVVEIGCRLVAEPLRRSVIIALWDAEEPPTFQTAQMGSAAYATDAVVPLGYTDAALVLDLVGADLWPGYEGHFAFGEETSPALTAALDAAERPEDLILFRGGLHLVEETITGFISWSDYDAFRDRGVPVLFFSNGQNKRYHTPDDEVEFLNFPKMFLEALHIRSVLIALGNADATPQFDAAGQRALEDARTMKLVLEDALADGTGIVDQLGLTAGSRTALEGDRDAVAAVITKLEGGAAANDDDLTALRNAAQRVICLAGNSYSEALCGLF